jgi:hypothetical protein
MQQCCEIKEIRIRYCNARLTLNHRKLFLVSFAGLFSLYGFQTVHIAFLAFSHQLQNAGGAVYVFGF